MLALTITGYAAQAHAVSFDDLLQEINNLKQQVSNLRGELGAAVYRATAISAQPKAMSAISTNVTAAIATPVDLYAPGLTYRYVDGGCQAYDGNAWVGTVTSTNRTCGAIVVPTQVSAKAALDAKAGLNIGDMGETTSNQPGTTVQSNEPTKPEVPTSYIVSQQPTVVAAPAVTVSFTHNLTIGERGAEVKKLQDELVRKGYLTSDNATSFYGKATAAAVMSFQRANGINDDGTVVGPKTQMLLNGGVSAQAQTPSGTGTPASSILPPGCTSFVGYSTFNGQPCGANIQVAQIGWVCQFNPNAAPKLKVTSPDGGEIYTAGQPITVTWKTCNIPSSAYVDIFLTFPGINQGVNLTHTLNDGSQVVTLPSTSTWGQMVYGQNYKITIVGAATDASDNLFTINAPVQTIAVLSVAKNTAYANQTQSPNTAGVKIGSYVLQNNSTTESFRITSFGVGISGTAPLSDLSNLRTSETSGSGSVPIVPQASNNFAVNFILAPGASKIVDIFADTGSASGVNVVTTLSVTGVSMVNNVTLIPAATGQTITLAAGTLMTPTLIVSSSTQSQYIAAGGTGATDATRATYNLTSSGGSVTISDLKFTISGSAVNPVTSIKVNGSSAPVVANVAWLTGLNIAVPNGGAGTNVDVLVSYAPVGTNGVPSNTTAAISLTYVKYNSGGVVSVMTPTIPAPTMTLVGSKPTVSVNTAVTSGLLLGAENKIGQVTLTADPKGNIKINDLAFTYNLANFNSLAISNVRIADGLTTVQGTSCGISDVTDAIFCEFAMTGNTMSSGNNSFNTESNFDFDGYTIAAGTSKTFNLYATLVGTSNGYGIVSTSLNRYGFNWDDTATASFVGDNISATGSGTNLGAQLIYNFPTGSYSIRQ